MKVLFMQTSQPNKFYSDLMYGGPEEHQEKWYRKLMEIPNRLKVINGHLEVKITN